MIGKKGLWLVLGWVAFTAIVLLMACAPPADTRAERTDVAGNIERFIDHEAGVVCWVYAAFRRGGISCLPLSATNLEVGRVR